mgnify:CR=1 FL=1
MAAKSTKRKSNTRGKKKKTQENTVLHGEIMILGVLAVCIFLLISNFGLGGFVGDMFSAVMFGIFGWIAYPLPVLIFGITAFMMSNKGNVHAYIKAAAMFMFSILLTAFSELLINSYEPGTKILEYYRQASIGKEAGGLLGGCLISLLCPAIGVAGTYIVLILLMMICMILVTEKSLLKPLGHGSKRVYEDARKRHETAAIRSSKRKEERQKTRSLRLEEEKNMASAKSAKRQENKISGVSFATTLTPEKGTHKSPELQELNLADGAVQAEPLPSIFEGPEEGAQPEKPEFVINRSEPVHMAEPEEVPPVLKTESSKSRDKSSLQGSPAACMGTEKTRQETDEAKTDTVDMEAEIKAQEALVKKEYKVPPLSLLKRGKTGGGDSDSHLRATAMKLEQTLQNFGVKVHVTNASCGPSVTRYELQPEQGVKVSKIVGLADDIKLNLAVTDLRIEAPIPGKAAVGIEVPNAENTAVMLRDLLEAAEFQKSNSKITFAVGKDIAGKVVVADIAKMPHLLVAGSTGSGKSVCINTLIMSIIYKTNPEDVKLIMVDPKVVELSVYNGIPHLLIPVVTDPRKAAGALNWAVAEMMKRYQMFAEYNVRDLKGFNEKISQLKPADGEELPKKMPQIVIIVDELADLMMVAPKDVEGAICRLAQLARAAGLHLILATQRPSVNVITGLIKANMPSRIAFAVSSGVDSRTIIDMNGAEKLLGKGDMLFYPTGYPKPVRVQGSFVSDKEVQKVVDYLIENYGNVNYTDELESHMNADLEDDGAAQSAVPGAESTDGRDSYFADAGRLIIDKEKASIGMLQRMFKIGFNRAARIMDQLAEAGVVGPEEGTKPRKVLMIKEEFEQYIQENK